MQLHDGEVPIDDDLVHHLVATQFPELAELPIARFASTGTVNAIYRIGNGLCARLPRLETWASDLARERTWLPRLARRLSLRIPEPVAQGEPTDAYPFPWANYRRIDGRPFGDAPVHDEVAAAEDLARFVRELRDALPVEGAPAAGRRPLRELDAATREAIRSARDAVDGDATRAAWELALQAPAWSGKPVWIHADLLRPNVLVADGHVTAVIDFGAVGVGDPAADVIAAWSIFGRTGREAYRAALGVDDGTWARARGYALTQAAMIIPYYAETNPAFVTLARRTIEEVLAELAS